MALLQSLEEIQAWDSYRTYTKERLKLLGEGDQPIFVSREKIDFDLKGKPWPGAAFLVGEKGAVLARKLKASGVKFHEGTCRLADKQLEITGIPGAPFKRARLTMKKLVLGYTLYCTDDPSANADEDGDGAAPPPPGLGLALEARLAALLPAVKTAAEAKPEQKGTLTSLVTAVKGLIGKESAAVAEAALDKLEKALGAMGHAVAQAGVLMASAETFQKLGYDEKKAVKMAKLAEGLKAKGYDEKKVVAMAKRAQDLEDKGYAPKRAVACAMVHQDLVDEGIPEKKVEQLATMTSPKGLATVDDAKAAAREMAKFPEPMLAAMSKGGAAIVSCRGSVTDALPELKGVKPRGWPEGMTWDNVPGLYDPSSKEVLLATKGADRHVAKNGEDHGAFDLAGHEGGHCYDAITGSKKSNETAFKNARQKDVDRLAKDGKDLGAYFMQAGSAGREETFAESCARYFGKDRTMAGDWTELHKFFSGNPYGS